MTKCFREIDLCSMRKRTEAGQRAALDTGVCWLASILFHSAKEVALTWLQPQPLSYSRISETSAQAECELQTLQEISITFEDPHSVLFIVEEDQQQQKSDELKQMQAAAGKHVLCKSRTSGSPTGRDVRCFLHTFLSGRRAWSFAQK
jgi:hypothetical protein